MELDQQQKEDFMSYWGRCPLVDKTGLVVFVDGVENMDSKDQLIFGTAWHRDKLANGEWRMDTHGFIRLSQIPWKCHSFAEINPLFIEPGYYQCFKDEAMWISRRPERGMAKGMAKSNTSFIRVRPFQEKSKKAILEQSDWDSRSLARIAYNQLPYVRKEQLDETIAKAMSGVGRYSFALSKNVAVVSHSSYEIPVVMYKLTPVGYYMDGKVFLSKKKDVSKEMIEEEAKLSVEIYEE